MNRGLDGKGFCQECFSVSLIVWSWNGCGLSEESLSETICSLSREQNWDVVLLQESLKNVSQGARSFEGGMLAHAGASHRQLVLGGHRR